MVSAGMEFFRSSFHPYPRLSSPPHHHLGFIRYDSTTRLTTENTPRHALGEHAVLVDAEGAPGAPPRAASIPTPRCARRVSGHGLRQRRRARVLFVK